MIDRCVYDLCVPAVEGSLSPSFRQLPLARKMAELLLRQRPMEAERVPHSGPNADLLWLPLEDHGTAYVQLMLVDLDVETLTAVAEIAKVLGAQFVPRDGGPPIAADAEAICSDIVRRALHRIRTPGLSLYAVALAREAAQELVG